LVEAAAPDVAIVDVRMPPTHTTEGLEAARTIRRTHPRIAILVLSQYVETRYAVDLIRDDPSGIGYLLKDRVSRVADLAEAVRRVAAGGSVIHPEGFGRLSRRWPRAAARAVSTANRSPYARARRSPASRGPPPPVQPGALALQLP